MFISRRKCLPACLVLVLLWGCARETPDSSGPGEAVTSETDTVEEVREGERRLVAGAIIRAESERRAQAEPGGYRGAAAPADNTVSLVTRAAAGGAEVDTGLAAADRPSGPVAPPAVRYPDAGRAGSDLSRLRAPAEPVNRENYAHFDDNGIFRAAEIPVSTFSVDVDTGSYSLVRRILTGGQVPPRDAVRTEELVNYFDYDYPAPDSRDAPFSVTTEMGPAPWDAHARLLHIGIRGYEQDRAGMPPANLVFLVDVSGSMRSHDKLDLLKSSLKMLARQMRPRDRIAIAVYAGASGLVLESTPGSDSRRILAAIDQLSAGGRTHGAAGIRLAYAVARENFVPGGINRVLLATDGDFNVGTVNVEALRDLVAAERETGVTLTTLGFGRGNYNDHLMEQLADIGNGNYAYIDTLAEARKVLVEQMAGTLQTIASDVKIQVEFNPAVVAEYRLIGYENRVLAREDFNNDRVDAGDIGAGHTVTALYEIRLHGDPGLRIDPLRYGERDGRRLSFAPPRRPEVAEVAFLRLRYKLPGHARSRLIEQPVRRAQGHDHPGYNSDRFRFAAAVAAFGQMLRGGEHLGGMQWQDILELAASARGSDRGGYRGEFLHLVERAGALPHQYSRHDPYD